MKPTKRILFIGDSHTVLTFGDRWRELLIEKHSQQLELNQYAVSGSHLLHWMDGSLKDLVLRNLKYSSGGSLEKTGDALDLNLVELLRSVQPDEVIIALGTNDILSLGEQVKGFNYQNALAKLSELCPNLIWILPPQLKEGIASSKLQADYKAAIQQHFHRLLASKKFSPDQSDGVHFFQTLATQWADEVWNQYLDLQ